MAFSFKVCLSIAILTGPLPALGESTPRVITSMWDAPDLLSCYREKHLINGRLIEIERFSEESIYLGVTTPPSSDKSYQFLLSGMTDRIAMGHEVSRWATQMEVINSFQGALEKSFGDALPTGCLNPAERLASAIKGQALTMKGRKISAVEYSFLEDARVRLDPRPLCSEVSCLGSSDPKYFQANEETSSLMFLRDNFEDYACSLKQIELRLAGIQYRLEQKDIHEQETLAACRPGSDPGHTAGNSSLDSVPVTSDPFNSDISGTR